MAAVNYVVILASVSQCLCLTCCQDLSLVGETHMTHQAPPPKYKRSLSSCCEWVGVSEVPDGPRQSYLPLTLIWLVMLDLTRPRSKEIWPHGEVILQKNGCSTDPPKTAWAEEGKRMISANWSFNVQTCSKMNRVWKYLVNRLYLHVYVQQNRCIFKYRLFMCLCWIGL